MKANDRKWRIYQLFTVPLFCPVGLIALIVAHVLLAVGEVVLAFTHHDLAYLVLFTGDLLALLLICVKVYRRMKRTKPKSIIIRKHGGSKTLRNRPHTTDGDRLAASVDEKTKTRGLSPK